MDTTQTRPRSPGPVRVESPHGPAAGPIAAAGLAMLDQCAAFVASVGDGAYAADSATHRGGTIGKHVRHVLDHFRAALDGGGNGRGGGVIDYDHRSRNVPMETDRGEALEAIASVRSRLASLGEPDMARAVRVRVMLSGDGSEAELGSTLGRELAFASHHAVHHHAMLKAIAAEFGIDAGDEFGKAPSTLSQERAAG